MLPFAFAEALSVIPSSREKREPSSLISSKRPLSPKTVQIISLNVVDKRMFAVNRKAPTIPVVTAQPTMPVLFFLVTIAIIIIQNIRSKKKSTYENPYVDTKKIILPLTPDFKFPMVHYTRLEVESDEKILFVTETNQNENNGDFIITNKRVVIFSVKENFEIPLSAIDGIGEISSTVMYVSENQNKHFIFMHESQLKYALAILKWLSK